jgi:hypothetical protein
MTTFFNRLPEVLMNEALALLSPKDIYKLYCAADWERPKATTGIKEHRKAAIMHLCGRQSQDNAFFYQTLVFTRPANTQFFESIEEMNGLQAAIEKNIASPSSPLEHQLGGELFIAKLKSPDFVLALDVNDENIIKLLMQHPRVLRVLSPYTVSGTDKHFISKMMARLENVQIDSHQAKALAIFVPQADEVMRTSIIAKLKAALLALNGDASVLTALASILLHVNDSEIRLTLITDIIKKLGHENPELRHAAMQALPSLFLHVNDSTTCSTIIAEIIEKAQHQNLHNCIAECNTLIALYLQVNDSEIRSAIITTIIEKLEEDTHHSDRLLITLASLFSQTNDPKIQAIISAEIMKGLSKEYALARCPAMDALAIIAPHINDQETRSIFIAELIKQSDDENSPIFIRAWKCLIAFVSQINEPPKFKRETQRISYFCMLLVSIF